MDTSGGGDQKVQALLARIDLCRRRRDYSGARDLSAELTALRPEEATGYLFAGEAEIGLRNFKAAETRLREALALAPDSVLAHTLLASLLRETGRFPEAEEQLQKALEIEPEDVLAWCELSHLCHAQGDLLGTKRYAQKALKLDPENATALNLLGMAVPEDSPRSLKDSLRAYQRALEADPEDASVHNNLGVTYLELKDYARAESSFRHALSLNPQEALFRKNLYIALKHRSALYRFLNLPGDLLGKAIGYVADHYWVLFILVAIPAAVLRARTRNPWFRPIVFLLIPFALFVVWFLVFKPLMLFYEFLMLRDIRLRASGRAPLTGGPFWIRYALFFAVMCGVWIALGFAIASPLLRPWVIGGVVAGMAGFILFGVFIHFRDRRREGEASRRRSRFARTPKATG